MNIAKMEEEVTKRLMETNWADAFECDHFNINPKIVEITKKFLQNLITKYAEKYHKELPEAMISPFSEEKVEIEWDRCFILIDQNSYGYYGKVNEIEYTEDVSDNIISEKLIECVHACGERFD